jgi:hypothetical protein
VRLLLKSIVEGGIELAVEKIAAFLSPYLPGAGCHHHLPPHKQSRMRV